MIEAAMVATGDGVWERLDALVDGEGTAAHPFPRALRRPRASRRDLADAAHALCVLHGTRPGLADEAARGPAGIATDWLSEVAEGLARERDALARLAAAAGPLPSTPGQAATDAAFVAQRHAFQMLARSDRMGVGVGAAAAVAFDWIAVRHVMARVADAYGVELAPLALPDMAETATVLSLATQTAAAERALLFGARALLEQHRALWSLLEARASARQG